MNELVFSFFRFKGKASDKNLPQLIVKASANNNILNEFYIYWKNKVNIEQAKNIIDEEYFPLFNSMSEKIDRKLFFNNHKVSPNIFIRCIKSYKEEVINELNKNNFHFDEIDDYCISFSSNYKLTNLESFKSGYFYVQDISSQKCGELFTPIKHEAWWDCCAGAGGKSLLLLQKEPGVQLFVSDIRLSILNNLQERLHVAGFKNYTTKLIDLENEIPSLPQFDAIIADVPCSGSGTWARSPEELSFFDVRDIEYYTDLQRRIMKNVLQQLQPNGKIYYLTCSVYKDENEENVSWFSQQYKLQIIEEKYFQYSHIKGDTMYGAVLEKT